MTGIQPNRRSQGGVVTDRELSLLYIGPDVLTSGHRARALERLGHRVVIVNPRDVLPSNRLLNYWSHHTGCALMERSLCRTIYSRLPEGKFDLVFVGTCELVGPSLVRDLKARFGTVIAHCNDDPYGQRDGWRWRLFLKSIALYDLVVVVRDCNVAEAIARGAKDVIRVSMSADEVAHCPRIVSTEDREKWSSEVAFIGTWMPEAGSVPCPSGFARRAARDLWQSMGPIQRMADLAKILARSRAS